MPLLISSLAISPNQKKKKKTPKRHYTSIIHKNTTEMRLYSIILSLGLALLAAAGRGKHRSECCAVWYIDLSMSKHLRKLTAPEGPSNTKNAEVAQDHPESNGHRCYDVYDGPGWCPRQRDCDIVRLKTKKCLMRMDGSAPKAE